MAFVQKCVQDGANLIKAKGDSGMASYSIQARTSSIAFQRLPTTQSTIQVSITVRLVVYYRINGMVPPESRQKN